MILTLDKVVRADTSVLGTAGAETTYFFSVKRNYLTAEDDPVLAELWDNPEDAAYDEEGAR
ncbi:MAG TPA: hypothetical protein VJB57_19205 [Dehalococcoidia bacterium]|nr:hypothetical protein [Dehalococcoidia bacterium]